VSSQRFIRSPVPAKARLHVVNASPLPEILSRRDAAPQGDLPLAAEGVLRYVWESKFGPMLIEVTQGQVYVNGQPVAPADEH
jgi:hypothetical protein